MFKPKEQPPPITKDELHRWRVLLGILVQDCQTCVGQIERLDQDDPQTKSFHTDSIGNLLWHQNRFVLITQLAKVFAKPKKASEKVSLAKLFAVLSEERHEREVLQWVTTLEDPPANWMNIQDLRSFVKRSQDSIAPHMDLINKVTHLRNTVTAHSHGTYDSKPLQPTKFPELKKLKALSEVGNTILRELNIGMGTFYPPTGTNPSTLNAVIKGFRTDRQAS